MKSILIGILIIVSGAIIYIAIPKKSNKHMNIKQRILKAAYPLVMKMSKKNHLNNSKNEKPSADFFNLKIMLNDGSMLPLDSFKGKKIMIVNTASDCGFTGQYDQLEELYQKHKDRLIIIGFPSNEFGNQEKGNDASIESFCKINYGVHFPIAIKGEVLKSDTQQDVYKWLTDGKLNGWNNQVPTWNFCKYLIDENGVLVDFFNSGIDPLGSVVEEALGRE
jgi:glutathione peroxidase